MGSRIINSAPWPGSSRLRSSLIGVPPILLQWQVLSRNLSGGVIGGVRLVKAVENIGQLVWRGIPGKRICERYGRITRGKIFLPRRFLVSETVILPPFGRKL